MTETSTPLTARIVSDLGTDVDSWITPTGYPAVACAVLDAIYSTGNHYTGVTRLVARYQALREEQGADGRHDGPAELVALIQELGGAEAFAQATNNRWRTSSRKSAPRKAEAALGAAKILADHELLTRDEIAAEFSDRETRESHEVVQAWHRLPGQSTGLTWNYFLMLMGLPGVKSDRMVRRFVTRALGNARLVGAKEASRLVEESADALGVSYTVLDHAIWRFESGRSPRRKDT